MSGGKSIDSLAMTPGRQWARQLAAREASGETLATVAVQFWREALGVDPQADARSVVERMRQQDAQGRVAA